MTDRRKVDYSVYPEGGKVFGVTNPREEHYIDGSVNFLRKLVVVQRHERM